MKFKIKLLLGFFVSGAIFSGVVANSYLSGDRRTTRTTSPRSSIRCEPRATEKGVLLSSADPVKTIAKAKNRAAGRSPAFEADATVTVDIATLERDFLARDGIAEREEALQAAFPDGKGVNRSIRFFVLLSQRGMDSADSFSEIELANHVRSEIITHGEVAVVSIQRGLAQLTAEQTGERQSIVRLLSALGAENPAMRDEVKTILLGEAHRPAPHYEVATSGTLAI